MRNYNHASKEDEIKPLFSFMGQPTSGTDYSITGQELLASLCNLYKKINAPDANERITDLVWDWCRNNIHPYYDGDILLVEDTPDVEIGQIGIFVLNGTGYVKRKGENGLISLNPKYSPIEPCDSDDCRCIGKVIGKL